MRARAYRTITNINETGRCEAWDLYCKHEGSISALRVKIDKKLFCCEECANDYYGEVTEGTYQPFPSARGALTAEQIIDNQIEQYDRYEREYS